MLNINSTYVDAMFAFAERRHRFALGERIDDDILRKHSFSNIYCELDTSTRVVREGIESGHYPRGLLGAMLRVLFNQEHTLRTMMQYPLCLKEFIEEGDYTNLLKVLQLNYCTHGAEYMVRTPNGYSKIEGLLLVASEFREKAAWKKTDDYLFGTYTDASCCEDKCNHYTYKTIAYWLSQFKYIGQFLANEIAYEISQQIPKPFRDANTFALCGASTLRGIARLQGKYDKSRVKNGKGNIVHPCHFKEDEVLEVLQYLLSLARKRFNNDTNAKPTDIYYPIIRLREITRILGEFDRYERYRLGQRLYDIGDRIHRTDDIEHANRIVFDELV